VIPSPGTYILNTEPGLKMLALVGSGTRTAPQEL